MKKKNIPEFKSEAGERKFWATAPSLKIRAERLTKERHGRSG